MSTDPSPGQGGHPPPPGDVVAERRISRLGADRAKRPSVTGVGCSAEGVELDLDAVVRRLLGYVGQRGAIFGGGSRSVLSFKSLADACYAPGLLFDGGRFLGVLFCLARVECLEDGVCALS